MKVFENIENLGQQYWPETFPNMNIAKSFLGTIIKAFCDIRMNEEATCKLIHEFPLSDGESMDLSLLDSYPQLIFQVTADDYVSFYYLRNELRNSICDAGEPYFDILPDEAIDYCDVNIDVIKYSIDFDFEEIFKKVRKIGSLIKKRDYLGQILSISGTQVLASSAYKDRLERDIMKLVLTLDNKLLGKNINFGIMQCIGFKYLIPEEERGILYNYWDSNFNKYQRQANEAKRHTFEQLAIINPLINERYFVNKASEFYRELYKQNELEPYAQKGSFFDELSSLYDDFMQRAEVKHSGDIKQLCNYSQDWVETTKRRLLEAHYRLLSTIKPSGDNYENEIIGFLKSTTRARKAEDELFGHLYFISRKYIKLTSGNPYKEIYNVIPFNVWGNDYDSIIESKKSSYYLESKDQVLFDYDENVKVLYPILKNFSNRIGNAMALGEEYEHITKEYQDYIYDMAIDFINRLQKNGIYNPDYQSFALGEWMKIVIDSTQRVSLITLYDILGNRPDKNSKYEDRMMMLKFFADVQLRFSTASIEALSKIMTIIESIEARITEFDKENGPGKTNNAVRDVKNEKEKPGTKEVILNYIKTIVIDIRNADYIANFLTEHLCGATGDRAFIYIEAAINAKAINRPRYKDIVAAFGWIGKPSNYNKQVGKNKTNWFTNIKVIEDVIKSNMVK